MAMMRGAGSKSYVTKFAGANESHKLRDKCGRQASIGKSKRTTSHFIREGYAMHRFRKLLLKVSMFSGESARQKRCRCVGEGLVSESRPPRACRKN
jgi:hypothetical protein